MADTSNEMMENGTVTEQTQERTFTQAELDDIIKSRVAKERAKYGDYDSLREKASRLDEIEEANKTELQKATERAEALQKQLDDLTKQTAIRDMRTKVSQDTGVPINLLLGETEEACTEQANAILAFKSENSVNYPTVKDGGEVSNISTTQKTNGQLFGDWLNEQLSN